MNKTIGFIGGGNMAQAIIRGLLAAGHPAQKIAVADPGDTARSALSEIDSGMLVGDDNAAVAAAADVLVLATKPQYIVDVAQQCAGSNQELVVSIAAGITLASIEAALGDNVAVVRIMPNTPSLVGRGMAGLVGNAAVGDAEKVIADSIVAATGTGIWVSDEAMMDAVTAVSGSGPAYFFMMMELLADGAESFGFDKATARQLAVETALGAATLASAEDVDLAELRRRVTSPGGTTEAACTTLEAGGIRELFEKALTAARDRSIELGKS